MGGYEHHPVFERPSPETRLWRFIDFAKFVDLIDRQALFFARADRVGDPWEGSVSQVTIDATQEMLLSETPDTEIAREGLKKLRADEASYRRRLALFMHMSCWYADEGESAAMWALHAGRDSKGVAIQTSFEGLEKALPAEYEHGIYAGKVRYIDYERDPVPTGNSYGPFLTKRRSFEHEREVRALIDVSTWENVHPSYAKVPTIDGLSVGIDLGVLLERIYVAPVAEGWFYELVQRTARRYAVSAPVIRSDLDLGPVY